MKSHSAEGSGYVEFATAVSGRLLRTAALLTTDRHLATAMSTRDGLPAVGSYTLANDGQDFFPPAMERPNR